MPIYIKSGSVDIFDGGICDPPSASLTPIEVAIREAPYFSRFSYDIVKLLLDRGCDPNSIVSFDERPSIPIYKTAMVKAFDVRSQELVKLLTEHGAHVNPGLCHMVRRTPLEMAAENGFQPRNFKKAMRLAGENGHFACRYFIAELANLPLTATDVPPVVSPLYADWPG